MNVENEKKKISVIQNNSLRTIKRNVQPNNKGEGEKGNFAWGNGGKK